MTLEAHFSGAPAAAADVDSGDGSGGEASMGWGARVALPLKDTTGMTVAYIPCGLRDGASELSTVVGVGAFPLLMGIVVVVPLLPAMGAVAGTTTVGAGGSVGDGVGSNLG